MDAEVTVRIGGREVKTISLEISSEPIDIEQHTQALKDRLGQAVLPQAFG